MNLLCEGRAANAHLISELAYARPQDGIDLHAPHQIWMPRNDITQLQPQLVLGLALQASEGVVIHHSCQLLGSFAPASLRHVKSYQDEQGAALEIANSSKAHAHSNGQKEQCV